MGEALSISQLVRTIVAEVRITTAYVALPQNSQPMRLLAGVVLLIAVRVYLDRA
jgi:hypothetical protein